MKIKDVDKKEIIKLSAFLLGIAGADEVERNFPTFSTWCQANISGAEENELIEQMIAETKKEEFVSINITDFIDLYAHTQAVLGFEEMKQRFPKVRLLVLNVLDQKGLDRVMSLIKSIEERIQLNH